MEENMKLLEITLEDLVSSFTYDSGGLSKEYLHLETGEIVHITEDVAQAVEIGADYDAFQDWEKDLVPDARDVLILNPDNYIFIPNIERDYIHDTMIAFAKEEVNNEIIKEKLLNALNENRPSGTFKEVLHNYTEALDQWYAYEEESYEKYVLNWLKTNKIQINERAAESF
jgi:predicted ATP-dependent endonuclease of OLD family